MDIELGSSPLAPSGLVLLDRVSKLVFFGAGEDLEVLRVKVEAELKIWNPEEEEEEDQHVNLKQYLFIIKSMMEYGMKRLHKARNNYFEERCNAVFQQLDNETAIDILFSKICSQNSENNFLFPQKTRNLEKK